MMNKRSFMVGVVSAAVVPQAIGTGLTRAPGTSAEPALAPLSDMPSLRGSPGLDAWQAYLGQDFEIGQVGRPVQTVTLNGARALPRGADPIPTQQYSLEFAGASLAAGTYTLRHRNGESAQLYLAGVGPAAPATLRADFNLI